MTGRERADDPPPAPEGPSAAPLDPLPPEPSTDREPAPDERVSARELVRRRSHSYTRAETGRHHHMGSAPQRQPLMDADGVQYVGTADVQLASRTTVQLRQQRERTQRDMQRAAAELQFEAAGQLRDDLARVDAELHRRESPPG